MGALSITDAISLAGLLLQIIKDMHKSGAAKMTPEQHAAVKTAAAGTPWQFTGSGPPP